MNDKAARPTLTRLGQYIEEWGVKPTVFARRAGISSGYLLRLRRGLAEPTRDVMVRLALTASAMRSHRVAIVEMFELTETEELTHALLVTAKVILATVPLTE